MKKVGLFVLVSLFCVSLAYADENTSYLQDVSVTVLTGGGSGSGVLISRKMKENKDSQEETVNFVLTAAHVVDSLRTVRTIVDPKSGTEKKVVEFKPMNIAKDSIEKNRKVGETRMEGKVIKFSDSEDGQDLALCMLFKRNYSTSNTRFYLENTKVPEVGTQIWHVGSLLGQDGSNSMTQGIISQVGRVLQLGGSDGRTFIQSSAPAFPGSSGGGIFIAEGPNKGRYCGMLVRGAGETFTFCIGMDRLHKWAVDSNLEWILDETKGIPTVEELEKLPIE